MTLSEIKRLVLDVSRKNETASFGVTVEPKLTAVKHNSTDCVFTHFVIFVSRCFALTCIFCLVVLHFGLF